MHFNVEKKRVVFSQDGSPNLGEDITVIWDRQEFAVLMGVPIREDILFLHYAPERGLYTITNKTPDGGENQVVVLSDPDEDAVMRWVHRNLASIQREAELKVLMDRREYPGDAYTWNDTTLCWDYTQDPDAAKIDNARWLRGHADEMAVALSYLWEIADRKGLLDGESVPFAVTKTISKIVSARDDIYVTN